MLTRLLLLILLVVAVVSLFKSQTRPRRDLDEKDMPGVEDMVRCKVCGINLPRSEAIMSQGRIYCCDEHRRQDRA